jgi:hypothetical protein
VKRTSSPLALANTGINKTTPDNENFCLIISRIYWPVAKIASSFVLKSECHS